ncbi:hypothetical protein DENIS_3923 [Desulfonema ishimotonii]|uniref:Peptidase S8/S53 domain-containing protein n=1 Tax=Desulfonema ishimotonii TaxID=45657 RepID=A0A401G138_9BACT|nr:hypothetical protein DENIS_3923 [Desulfonema ishimotonii]
MAAVGNHSNWINDGGAGDGGAGEGGADDDATGDLDAYPVMYPAAYPEVIAVGAHDSLGYFADFSNDRPEPDVTAPGVNVFSTTLDGGYGAWNGTSMAPPMSLPELQ